MATSGIFSGPDRVEFLKSFGRPVRQGSLAELKVSDAARVREAIRKGDAAGARNRLALLLPIHSGLVTTYLEWAYATRSRVAAHSTKERERELAGRCFRTWEAGLSTGTAPFQGEAVDCVRGLLDPESVGPETIGALRSNPGNAWSTRLNQLPAGEMSRLHQCLDGGAADDAIRHFDAYLEAMRDRHDLIGRYVGLYGTELAAVVGQHESLGLVQEGLESCAALAGMWGFVGQARPEDLVLMLAEHLRAHFSGEGREGGVEIVEEPDRYRLIFAPCGTGGVLRHPAVPGIKPLPEATPETWHRAGQVPAYCAHCAKNELTSIRRFGHPAWVTEFDPDPKKPCGWTVYKDPKLIPKQFFERLGLPAPTPAQG
ncbi:MAG TPA: hypothetical protein VE981_12755 [Planctomycetota bacterium]|nr:hypothetical protein [Planctomycetota bacterium]